MLRTLIYALGILHLGPGLAFAILAFGCGGVRPALGPLCGHQQIHSFIWLTLAGWLLMTAGLLLYLRFKRGPGNKA